MILAMVIIHQWQMRRDASRKKFNAYIFIGTLVIISLTIFSSRVWLGQTLDGLTKINLSDFDTLNLLSRWRLEFFRAALVMFEAFPLLGVGQANLFRLSADIALGQSVLMAYHGGGDAHNYFLQTLAETGLIGGAAFTCVFIWPYLQINNRRFLIPCTMAIIAVFLGNIYSHSLIIRDNLFLLATMIALLYAHAADDPKTAVTSESLQDSSLKSLKVLVYTSLIFLLMFFCIREITGSFSTPFFTPRLERP
jgi:O-antigen ligase